MKKLLCLLAALALALAALTACEPDADAADTTAAPVTTTVPTTTAVPVTTAAPVTTPAPVTTDAPVTAPLTAAPEKPVIYLYPTAPTRVTVELDFAGQLTATYPAYGSGWTVDAAPDGTLTDPATGREYYCLFWEGIADEPYDLSDGFVVPGDETAAFLEDALTKLGLTDREANEFIIYWLPRMEDNAYNLISFQQEPYTEQAKLTVTPAPDTLIRVFMAWKPLDAPIVIEPQALTAPERDGFTVVEWGGAEMR